jgi:hypothetical protein
MRGVLTREAIADRIPRRPAGHTVFSAVRTFACLIVTFATFGSAACIGVTGKPVVGGSGSTATPEISVTPTSVSFGTVNIGATASQSMVIANNGTADLSISQVSLNGGAFTIANLSSATTISAGQSTTFTAAFKPSASGNASGSISIMSNAPGSPITISLSGVGETTTQGTPFISASPVSANFGNVIVGNTDSQIISLSNTGTANLSVTSITQSGPGFTYAGPATPFVLTPGQNTSFTADFGPLSPGSQTGSVSIASDAANSPLVVSLSGTGVAATRQLSASATSLTFGNVTVGNPTTQNVTVTNVGNSNVNVSSVSASGAGFTESGGASGALTPNQSMNISVTFDPSALGSDSGNLSITSNAQSSPLAVSLSGTGAALPSVALAWLPSTSQVIGYFVYRKTPTDNQYSKLNAIAVAATKYIDPNVSSNQTYDYAVTSVDSSNVESAFSNQVTIKIP